MTLIVPDNNGGYKRRAYNPYREIYQYIDEFMVGLAAAGKEQANLELECKPGCAACCTYLLGGYDIEAEAIVDYIERELPTKRRNAMIQRIAAWAAEWLDRFPGDTIGQPHHALLWQAARIACPMLDLETNLCQVYDVRPSVCRTFHATTNQKVAENQAGQSFCETGTQLCEPRQEAPEACWTTDGHVACGHMPSIFMLRNDINELVMPYMLTKMTEHRPRIGYGVVPIFMLKIGKEKYNWRPGSFTILPVLQNGVID